MIEVDHVTKKFRTKTVLDGVTLSCHRGIYGILGPNGAGKTTLMRCMMGLYPVNGGSIDVPPPSEIGYLPQKFGLFREMTVYDMLYYLAALKKIPKESRDRAISDALSLVNMEGYEKTRIAVLSGGMQRRIGIAQAILGNPHVIFFDEPTVGLDPEERKRFKSVVRELGKTSTVLFSTHIVEDLEAVCDHIIIMDRGRVLYSGSREGILCSSGEGVLCSGGEGILYSGGRAGISGETGEELRTLEDAYFSIIGEAKENAAK